MSEVEETTELRREPEVLPLCKRGDLYLAGQTEGRQGSVAGAWNACGKENIWRQDRHFEASVDCGKGKIFRDCVYMIQIYCINV